MTNMFMLLWLLLMGACPIMVHSHTWHGRPSVLLRPEFARYVAKNAEWGIISAYSPIYKQPFGTLISFADGNTGVPYFYISEWSTTWKNIMWNNTVSLTVSEAESDYCEGKGLDPMEPTCGRIMLTGHVVRVEDPDELGFAKKAVFAKHPAMKGWPKSHQWQIMKLDLATVNVLSYYGGMAHVPLKKYYNVKPTL